jgi:hypothetical protein
VFGWAAILAILWELFVPDHLSVNTFVLLGTTGLLALVAGMALWAGGRPSQSVNDMLQKLDSPGGADRSGGRR